MWEMILKTLCSDWPGVFRRLVHTLGRVHVYSSFLCIPNQDEKVQPPASLCWRSFIWEHSHVTTGALQDVCCFNFTSMVLSPARLTARYLVRGRGPLGHAAPPPLVSWPVSLGIAPSCWFTFLFVNTDSWWDEGALSHRVTRPRPRLYLGYTSHLLSWWHTFPDINAALWEFQLGQCCPVTRPLENFI